MGLDLAARRVKHGLTISPPSLLNTSWRHRAPRTQVHYDCTFRGIDAVSSRSARLLGGNRVIAEVCEAESAPRPPPALVAAQVAGVVPVHSPLPRRRAALN